MRVMIVDDEINIREGLKTLVDWESLGCDVVGEAADGLTAYEAIKNIEPEVCIIDIRMPHLDGIGVIEKLYKEGYAKTEFIILSGYGEFEYAKRAMACDVNHYVLKPIDETVLAEKVKEIGESHHKKNLHKQMVMDKALMQLLTGDQSHMDALDSLKLPWSWYQVISIQSGLDYKTVKDVMDRYFTKEHYMTAQGDRIHVLMKDTSFDKTFKCVDTVWEVLGKETSVAVGRPVTSLDKLHESYLDTVQLLKYKYIYMNDCIMTYHMLDELSDKDIKDGIDVDALDIDNMIHHLMAAIETSNMDTINDSLEVLLASMLKSGLTEKALIAHYVQFYIRLVLPVIRNDNTLNEEDYLNDETIKGFYLQKDLRRLHGYIKYHIMELSEMVTRNKPEDKIEMVKTYIRSHYKEELLLEDLANMFSYNSSYLGKQFKEKAGMGFNAFLDQVRMDHAKELLQDKSRKIYDIAADCGFKDPDYFATKFKKYMGMTPNQYRKTLGSK